MSEFFTAMLNMFEFPNISYNYFDGSTKLFLNLFFFKFLDISAKSFFSCIQYVLN